MIELPDFTELTSSIQARFQIERGEVLVIPITDGMVFMRLVGDVLETHFQPPRGSSRLYTGSMENFDQLIAGFQEGGVRLYYCKGWSIDYKKNGLIDGIADKLKK